jgi:hypothetical protein
VTSPTITLGEPQRWHEPRAIEEAVAIRRQLAEARPDAFLPGLASSLNNQSNRLGELGRDRDALAATAQAAAIYRRLSEE